MPALVAAVALAFLFESTNFERATVLWTARISFVSLAASLACGFLAIALIDQTRDAAVPSQILLQSPHRSDESIILVSYAVEKCSKLHAFGQLLAHVRKLNNTRLDGARMLANIRLRLHFCRQELLLQSQFSHHRW